MTYYGREVYERMRDWWDNLPHSDRPYWLVTAGGHPYDVVGLSTKNGAIFKRWSELRALTRDKLTRARVWQALEDT